MTKTANKARRSPVSASPTIESAKRPKQAEVDIDRAVERIYRTYGPDLSAFFNAVDTEKRRERSEKRRTAHV